MRRDIRRAYRTALAQVDNNSRCQISGGIPPSYMPRIISDIVSVNTVPHMEKLHSLDADDANQQQIAGYICHFWKLQTDIFCHFT